MLNTVPEAIEDIKNGKLIIVVDDEDRENEGDFVTAAQNATPEVVNFMSTPWPWFDLYPNYRTEMCQPRFAPDGGG